MLQKGFLSAIIYVTQDENRLFTNYENKYNIPVTAAPIQPHQNIPLS